MTKRTKKSVIKDGPIGGRLVEVYTSRGTKHRLTALPPKPIIDIPTPVGKRRRVEKLYYEQEHPSDPANSFASGWGNTEEPVVENYLASAKSDWNNYADFTFGSSPQHGKHGSGQEIVIVHVNGVHRLVAYPCVCPGAVPLDEQYLIAGLYPSTYKSVETVFTFQLLRDYNLAVLECCTSAGEYFSKLRRLTNPDFPDAVPNRHRELLRAARQFRHLQELVRFGYTTREAASKPGSMALFCAACPQPDVNLEENWEQDKKQWKFSMSFVADGNFVCVRQSKKGAGQDLFLKQGGGYFVESRAYKHHLASATENTEASTCNEHRAVADKNKAHKGYDATGIGALACARHGAFVPSSVVDFQKGERQMNMDYALCEGLKAVVSPKVQRIIFIYDICCQYWKNLAARVKAYNDTIKLPWYDRMIFSIGQCHVHGHQEKCLPRFSPLYIDGIGWNHGEILEPNWSLLNSTGTMTSTMTEAHRMEVLDSKMMDLNWKKMTNLYKTLPKSLKKAYENLSELLDAVEMLKSSASAAQREQWDQQLADAQKKREKHHPEAMDILMSTIDKAPSRKAIEASLITNELKQSRHVGLTSWVHDGMMIQELQMDVLSAAKELGSTPTDDQRLELEKKRAALKAKHDQHLEKGLQLFPRLSQRNDADPRSAFLHAPIREPCDCEQTPCGHSGMDFNPFEAVPKGPLERLAVLMPSSEPAGSQILPEEAKVAELELRKAQADEALANLRTQVGYKSFLFKANIQLAQNKAQKTRGYAAVASAEKAIQRSTRIYNQAQWAIWQLTADASVRETYRKLNKGDAKPLESVYQPNAPGQSRQVVSWIWGWKHHGQSTNPEFLLESVMQVELA
ncbi:hypothetical protein CC2G_003113 [Coprinopsis cinerea AmutBmut pab1-1]|nr:hypothetical protein CC2G_003113 [Coprinopsis cinerea AmutBmut pab1-1]